MAHIWRRDEPFHDLVLDRMPKGNQVNMSTLPAGTLFWRVRAMDSLGNPGAWSTTFQLTVTSGSG